MAWRWACAAQFCACHDGHDFSCRCVLLEPPTHKVARYCAKCNARVYREEAERTVLDALIEAEPKAEEPEPVPVLPGQRSLFP